jgi:hypothetical protein
MTDIEIPHPNERKGLYRWFERAPFLLSLSVLLFPIILSFFSSLLAGLFVISFVVIWFFRSVVTAVRATQGFHKMEVATKLDWLKYLKDIDNAEDVLNKPPKVENRVEYIHRLNLKMYLSSEQAKLKTKDVIHAIFIPTVNESYEILQPTLEACVNSTINTKDQAILIVPYEERAGADTKARAERIIKEYGDKFIYAEAIGHPDGLPGEVRGKGGNINFAAAKFKKWLEKEKIDPQRVLLTTLDADNRVHPQYFAAMSYTYLVTPARKYKSYQPVILYTNNIWDVPAVSRVLAVGNSFWTVMQSLRPHLLRNFSSHAQPMDALIDTNFWSARSVVEDGHQFWRSYFAFDGRHDVVPVFVPIYQDAVLAEGYKRTLRAQFTQLRRWAWGSSDIAFVAYKSFFTPNKVPKFDAFMKLARLTDNHVSWATSSLLIAFAAWGPLLLSPDGSDDIVAQQLPGFVSRISLISMVGIVVALYLMFRLLPNRPEHHGRGRYFWLLAQWILVPILGVVYGSLSSINAQTRLFLGKYLGFDVTEKAVKKVTPADK